MRRFSALTFTLVCGLAATAEAQVPRGLVGTWHLVSRVDRDPVGRVLPEPSLGADPLGVLIYDAGGGVAVQVMARHRTAAPCATTAAADSNNLAQIGGYDAYFGRYEVDAKVGIVTHVLVGALGRSDVGRRLTRRFRLIGDTLTLQFEPGGAGDRRRTRTLIFRRG